MKETKRMKKFAQIDASKKHPIKEALELVIQNSTTQFDEGVDVAVNLGVDTKQSDQQVRGAVALPHGLGKKVRVVVFAKGAKEQEAQEAGADFVGSDDLIEKIKKGWLDFDKVIATPDMMASLAKIAKILGPRGLMPSPKVGSVTMDIAKAVKAEKKGRLSFRVEKAGIVHASIGRKSMGLDKLEENYSSFLQALWKAKPSSSKGAYLKSVFISPTMGPSVAVEVVNA